MFGERRIMGGIGGLGSVVGESARLVPRVAVQMLLCFTFRPSFVSVPSIGSMMVLCFGRWHDPCVCGCGSKVFFLNMYVSAFGGFCGQLWFCGSQCMLYRSQGVVARHYRRSGIAVLCAW